jgi:hypothetical protein
MWREESAIGGTDGSQLEADPPAIHPSHSGAAAPVGKRGPTSTRDPGARFVSDAKNASNGGGD